jgi:hypothetical protein
MFFYISPRFETSSLEILVLNELNRRFWRIRVRVLRRKWQIQGAEWRSGADKVGYRYLDSLHTEVWAFLKALII